MAIIYTDPSHAGAPGDPYGSGGNAGNIYASPASWNTPFVMESGNTYRFKRSVTYNLDETIRTAGGEASKITVMPYYNSNGSDDTSKGYYIINCGVATTTSDWTSEGSNIWRLSKTGIGLTNGGDFYIYWGQYGSNLGRRRDTTNTTGSWGGAGIDVLANDFEWNYQSAPSGTTQNKVYGTVNPATTGSTAPIILRFDTAAKRDTYLGSAFYIRKNTGGIEIWGAEIKQANKGITLDCQSSASLWPGVNIHDNYIHDTRFGIAINGGHATNQTGFTGLKIENNRINNTGQGGIEFIGSPSWGCYGGTTIAGGASYIRYNIISNSCVTYGTGGIYLSRHNTGGTDKLWVQYNSIGKVYYGRFWSGDGYGIYCENATSDVMVHNNYMWNVYKGMIHKPSTAGNGSFKYNVAICDSSPSGNSGHTFFHRGIVDDPENPSSMTFTTLHYNIAKGFPKFLNIQCRWPNYEDIDVKGCWSRGVATSGTNNSGIFAATTSPSPPAGLYVGSLVAPALDMHFYGHDTGTSKIFYSELPTDDPANPGVVTFLNAGDRTEGAIVGPSSRTANGFIVNDNNNTNSLFIFDQLPHQGVAASHSVNVNYSLQLTDSFWHQIDSTIPEGTTAGTIINTLRKRQN